MIKSITFEELDMLLDTMLKYETSAKEIHLTAEQYDVLADLIEDSEKVIKLKDGEYIYRGAKVVKHD